MAESPERLQDLKRDAPVQDGRAGTIPWDIHVRAWQVYAACGHRSQSAARIAERGGFGWLELAHFLAERDCYGGEWRPLSDYQRRRLTALRAEGAEA